jgi:hypothetical protein
MKSIRKYGVATVRTIALPIYLRTLMILAVTIGPLPSPVLLTSVGGTSMTPDRIEADYAAL